MDIITSLKVFLLGIIWVGSFYMMAAYLLPIFPIPALLYLRKRLKQWSDNIIWLDEARAERRWKRSKNLFRFLVAVLWSALIGICYYLLIFVLAQFLVAKDPYFWVYYAIAGTLPLTYLVYRGVFIYMPKRGKLEQNLFKDNRSALERLQHPNI